METSEFTRGLKMGLRLGREMQKEEDEEAKKYFDEIHKLTSKKIKVTEKNIKRKTRTSWSKEDAKTLTNIFNRPYEDLVQRFPGKSKEAIQQKIYSLKLKRKPDVKVDNYDGLAKLNQKLN